ncbi:aminotransferase class IV [Aurantimicrobium photophilum]|uniref:4-amino-4-deoxychorismate lyase n=1 Tax=Aurantimicrobium photophilum TaxID=1987356 RepID=A0A2Z3S1J1_9MICO|nr:aminotransferase class IV [Aurantimicrobium photophilum]AWR21243.1 4-amino-4-deoxychorismate lyase [Aurantimicrobium photophilum]
MDVLRFRWNGSELVDVTGAPEIPLYVADSFLLNDGKVVAYQRHLDRFAASAEFQGLVRPLDDFLSAVTASLPRTGKLFPRIDLTERGELELHIRPAPELHETIVLATASLDPRVEPTIKGPDIPALNALRAEAQTQGADDAVILDAQGRVVDGSTTCLIWFTEGGLHLPPAEALRVNSVSVAVVRELAAQGGFSVSETWATPADLEGVELYAVNALHGIRSAVSWVNGPSLSVNEERLAHWRQQYDLLAEELPEA